MVDSRQLEEESLEMLGSGWEDMQERVVEQVVQNTARDDRVAREGLLESRPLALLHKHASLIKIEYSRLHFGGRRKVCDLKLVCRGRKIPLKLRMNIVNEGINR